MQYTRIRKHSLEKILSEIMLMCLGVNIRKYFSALDGNKLKDNYWKNSNNLYSEKFPFPE